MSASSSSRGKRASERINENGEPAFIGCHNCLQQGVLYIIMPSSGVKCATCARQGRKCVDVSWKSLDTVRTKEKEGLNKDLEEMERLIARISKRRKILALAEERAKRKTIYLVQELENEEEEQRKVNGGFSDVKLSEASRDLAGFLDSTDVSGGVDWSVLGVSDGSPIETRESSRGVT